MLAPSWFTLLTLAVASRAQFIQRQGLRLFNGTAEFRYLVHEMNPQRNQ